jgi:uncharacterized protein YndB with AHSA1/START domain
MIKKLLLGLLAVIVVICITASFQPDVMSVSRSATMSAPPEAIFKIVNDFRRWDEWSPWSRLDPAMTKTLEGPPEGVGAVYRWSGNNEVGEGSTTLTESVPNEKVAIKLEFSRPMEGTNEVQFTFAPDGSGTQVTWSMQGPVPFMGKVVSLFIDCEKMCGDEFLKGLANLKDLVENPTKA